VPSRPGNPAAVGGHPVGTAGAQNGMPEPVRYDPDHRDTGTYTDKQVADLVKRAKARARRRQAAGKAPEPLPVLEGDPGYIPPAVIPAAPAPVTETVTGVTETVMPPKPERRCGCGCGYLRSRCPERRGR